MLPLRGARPAQECSFAPRGCPARSPDRTLRPRADVPACEPAAPRGHRRGRARAGEPGCVAPRPPRRARGDGGRRASARGRRRRHRAAGRQRLRRRSLEDTLRRSGNPDRGGSARIRARLPRAGRALQGDGRVASRLSDSGRGAARARDPVTGFGAFAEGGLAWREEDDVVDLRALGDEFAQPGLNPLMALGPAAWKDAIAAARAHDGPRMSAAHARMRLPFDVADYVDFYASLEHASNLGRMFRPDQEPLLPNWRWLPVGYHGRAGTVAVSGTDVVRPRGQLGPGEYGPSRRLDV